MTAPELVRRPRRAVVVSSGDLVEESWLNEQHLPLVLSPRGTALDLVSWASANRERLEAAVRQHGGVLLRGFEVSGLAQFERFIAEVAGGALEYKERSSPRSQVQGNIYTSTDYPAHQEIFLHNENSYQHTWPLRIFFCCVTAPAEGGETPLADCRRVYQRLSPATRARFGEHGWAYVRNFGDGLGLDWRTVFQTEDHAAIADYCRQRGIEVEWKPGNRLRTRAVRRAFVEHPETGEPVWFNHATFFHVSTLPPELREPLLAQFGTQDLPTNTYYGDGEEIAPATLEELRAAYHAETVAFPWQVNDVLMLDNMLVAHGRRPFRGERKVVVGMGRPCSWEQLG